jgi:glycosyltransferase involved in cell wall biosynthesis
MEGLGSAALLAQAAGVPVVASRVGGLPEAVKFGELVDRPEDIPAAVDRARKIEVDVPAILREFGIPAMVERTIAVYRKVLEC